METIYDMHCHLGFAPDPLAVAEAGAAVGVRAFSCTVSPGEFEGLRTVLAPAVNVAVGLGAHPWWIVDGRVGDAALDAFCALAPSTRFIGEIGLDFAGSRDTEESRARQINAFERILSACNGHTATVADSERDDATGSSLAGSPLMSHADSAPKLISIHAVQSAGTVLDLLEGADTCERHRCIFHWFSGTSDELQRALKLGCFFSVGPRMLASRRGREYARQIPLDRLLLETDMPSREGDTLPANVWRAELGNALAGIAQLKGLDRDALATRLATTSAALLGR